VNVVDLIVKKRDGGAHSAAEIDALVKGFVGGEIPDYQISAWLMAVFLRGMDVDETVWLTDAMVRSGDRVDLSSVPGVKVDKHSTGGVADTTTLVLAPLVAACGVPVAKMSGRGLGHTGGTLDKLESIPGFRIGLGTEEFVRQVSRVGVAVIAQSAGIDPADKLMYALRDVTGTVPSVPLIVGSIISKKIAGGADAIVLDVKVGSGGFMKTLEEAKTLVSELERVGRVLGRPVECLMTDMDQPLGMAVGNALEVREAIETLAGEGPSALTELCMVFASRMLVLGGVASDTEAGQEQARSALADGSAIRKFEEWVEAQGGDPRIVEDPSLLPSSPASRVISAASSGWVGSIDAREIGLAAVDLGAGRHAKDSVIDPGAGLVLRVRVGDPLEVGAPIATLYAAEESMLDAAEARVLSSVLCVDERPSEVSLFVEG